MENVTLSKKKDRKVKEIQKNMYYETNERLRSSIWSRNF